MGPTQKISNYATCCSLRGLWLNVSFAVSQRKKTYLAWLMPILVEIPPHFPDFSRLSKFPNNSLYPCYPWVEAISNLDAPPSTPTKFDPAKQTNSNRQTRKQQRATRQPAISRHTHAASSYHRIAWPPNDIANQFPRSKQKNPPNRPQPTLTHKQPPPARTTRTKPPTPTQTRAGHAPRRPDTAGQPGSPAITRVQ